MLPGAVVAGGTPMHTKPCRAVIALAAALALGDGGHAQRLRPTNIGEPVLPGLADAKDALTFTHNGMVRSVAFSPDGTKLASVSFDRTLVIRDAATGKTLAKGESEGELSAVAFSPDGAKLITGGPDGVLRLWDAVNGKMLKHWQETTTHI